MNKFLLTGLLFFSGLFLVNAQYCPAGPSSTADSNVEAVSITGEDGTEINYTGCPGVTGVEDLTAETVNLIAGQEYTIDFTIGTCSATSYVGAGEIWIDFNQNEIFDPSESLGTAVIPTFNGGPIDASLTFTVPLISASGLTRMRVMQWEGGNLPLNPCGTFTWGSVIDFGVDIEVPESDCPFPTALATNVLSDTEVDLSWNGEGESEWTVEYGLPGFEPGAGEEINSFSVTTESLSITDLSANTEYTFAVQAVCATENSFWNTITATTDCGIEAAPFYENFDGSSWASGAGFNNAGDQFSPCWVRLPNGAPDYSWGVRAGLTGSSFGTGPSSDFSGSGNYIFVETNNGAIGNEANLETPFIDVSTLTEPALSFYYHRRGADVGDLIVEAKTDTDIEWIEVFTLTGQQQALAADPWLEAVVPLIGFEQEILQVRFRTTKINFTNGDVAIDEVRVEEAPSCFNVTGFTVAPAVTTAELNWDEIPSAVAGYDIEVFEDGEATPFFTVNVPQNETTFEVTDLTEGETYVVTINSNCGEDDGVGVPIELTFTTVSLGDTCEAAIEVDALPYTTTDDTANYSDFYNGSPGADCGSTSGYLGGNDVSYSYTPTEDQVVLVTMDPTNTWSGIFVYESCADIGNQCLNGEANANSDVRQFEVSLQGGQEYIFVISTWPAPQTTPYTFELEVVECGAVSGFEVDNITGLGADLNWDAVPGADNYQWIIVAAGGDPENESDVVATGTTAETSVTLDTLNDGTNYDAYIQSECTGDVLGNLTGPINFQTDCLSELVPTSNEDFSDATFNLNTAPGMPCWNEATGALPLDGTDFSPTAANSSWTNQAYANNTANPNGQAFYINLFGTGNDWFVSQEIDLGDNDDDLVVQFDRLVIPWTGNALVTDMGNHEVHVIISTDGGTTWNSDDIIKTYSGDGEDVPGVDGTEFVSLDGYSGLIRVGFYAIRTGFTPDLRFYIDNFRVLPAPTCFAPSGFVISEISLDSALATWDLDDNATEGYILEVYNEGDTQGVDAPVFEEVIASGVNSVLIDGLTEGTTYEVYLFSDCGVEDGVSVSSERTFSTANIGDTCEAAIEITDLPYTTSDSTSNYDNNYSGAPGADCGTASDYLNQNDVVYSYVAQDNGGLDITLTDIVGTYASVFVYDSCGAIGNFCLDGGVNPFIFDEQPDINLIEVPVVAGEEYFIVISHWFGTNVDYTLEIDFISCSRPNSLDTTIVGAGEIELQWTGSGNETQWEVQYGLASNGFDDEDNISVIVDQNSLLLDDLVSATNFQFWVRAVCDLAGEEYSAWVGPEAFRSPIIPIEIGAGEMHNEVHCYGNFEFTEWLFVSTADEELEMVFNAGSMEDAINSNDVLRIFDGFSEDGVLLYDSSVDGAILAGLTLTSTTGGLYLILTTDIVQSCQSGQGELPEEFDFDVFSETFSTPGFSKDEFSFYPNPVESNLYIQSVNPIETYQLFNIQGKRMAVGQPNETTPSISMQNLPSGLYFLKVTINGQSETFKVIKQ